MAPSELIADRYRIIKQLGSGGMGVVYLAEHVLLQKQLALKMLRRRGSLTPEVIDNFFNEARLGARLKHEHIVDVTDVGLTASGELFLAMEYLPGRPLSDLVGRKKPFSFVRLRAIIAQVCEATVAAHARDVIHCDLKPANIFLVEGDKKRDFVKILDFGLSALLEPGSDEADADADRQPAGTPQYMAPEQIQGGAPQPSFDIYAIGCVLYQMATGTVPFDAAEPLDVMVMQVTRPVVPPRQRAPAASITPELEAVILRALAKDPNQRFRTVRELALALAQCPGRARSPSAFEDQSTEVYFGDESTPLPAPLPPPVTLQPGPMLSLATLLRSDAEKERLRDAVAPGPSSSSLGPGGQGARGSRALLALAGAIAFLFSAMGVAVWWRNGAPRREAQAEAAQIGALIRAGTLIAPPAECAVARLERAIARHPDDPEVVALRSTLIAALDASARAASASERFDTAVALLEAASLLSLPTPERTRALAQARRALFARQSGMVPAGDLLIDRYEYPNEAGAAPLTAVDWPAADDLCKRAGKRLCSEAEWERACGAVGFDLAGKVAQWTSTPFRPGAPQMTVRGGPAPAAPAHAACRSRDYFMPGLGGARHIGFRCCY